MRRRMNDVLVHVDDLGIAQQPQCEVVQLVHLAANQQRRVEQRPDREMGVLLIRRQIRIVFAQHTRVEPSDNQHVGIGPESGMRPRDLFHRRIGRVQHGAPAILQIAPCPPDVRPVRLAPLRGAVAAAVGIDEVARLLQQFVVQHAERLDVVRLHWLAPRRLPKEHLLVVAPVVLHVVDAPFGPGRRIDRLVSIAAFVARARRRSWRGIDAELESKGMEIIRQRLHVREIRIRHDAAVGETYGTLASRLPDAPLGIRLRRPLPAIVEVHIAPTMIGQPLLDENASRLADDFVRHPRPPGVPCAPAHRRREADPIADTNGERLLRTPYGVPGRENQPIVAPRGNRPRQKTRLRVEDQSFRKPLHLDRERSLSRHGNTVQDRTSRPNAVLGGAVDARLWSLRWRKNAELRCLAS